MLSLDVTTNNKIHIMSSYVHVVLFVMFIFLFRRMIE